MDTFVLRIPWWVCLMVIVLVAWATHKRQETILRMVLPKKPKARQLLIFTGVGLIALAGSCLLMGVFVVMIAVLGVVQLVLAALLWTGEYVIAPLGKIGSAMTDITNAMVQKAKASIRRYAHPQ